jgi:plastocyanin
MSRSFSFRTRTRWLLGPVAGLALMAAALPLTTAAQDVPAAQVNIIEPSPSDIMGWGFDNSNLSIAVGQTVIWTNTGAQAHNITADDNSVDSGSLDPGATFSLTFDTPGTFAYHCTPHPWMKATITVTGA